MKNEHIHIATQITHGTLAIMIVFAIVGVSVFVSQSFNPRPAAQPTMQVAGATTNPEPQFNFENTYANQNHTAIFETTESGYEYEITLKSLPEGQTIVPLAIVTNETVTDGTITFKSEVEGYVLDNVKISLYTDSADVIRIFPASGRSAFNFAPKETKEISIMYQTDEAINYPFKVKVDVRW